MIQKLGVSQHHPPLYPAQVVIGCLLKVLFVTGWFFVFVSMGLFSGELLIEVGSPEDPPTSFA
jgi:hypothetical protein